jgi:hypothetical protein
MSWDDDFNYMVPASWSDEEALLYDDMLNGNPSIAGDAQLQFLYQEALYDLELSPMDRAIVQEMLTDYMYEQYGLVFDDIFDWDGYREWYDSVK